MDDDTNTRQQRGWMVARQLAARGIRDARVIEAMGRIPRHAFVAAAMRGEAYEDSPLPIEEGQTISQPYIVALMLQAARLGADDRMLEVGAGSGYASAVAAQLASRIAGWPGGDVGVGDNVGIDDRRGARSGRGRRLVLTRPLLP